VTSYLVGCVSKGWVKIRASAELEATPFMYSLLASPRTQNRNQAYYHVWTLGTTDAV